jgi:hypothetical protein
MLDSWALWVRAAAGVVVGGVVAAGGCATATEAPFGGGGEGGTPSSGGHGGDAGSGGTGGSSNLCGLDCGAIMVPQCLKSVCNEGMYMGTVGACVIVPADAGTACEDGVFCTADDTCDGTGECNAGPANDCGMQPEQCQQIQCNEGSQSCSEVPSANGQFCTPTDLCLVNATCLNGTCSGGTPKDCFFAPVPDVCHVAVCNPMNGQCEPVPGNDGAPCVDPMDLCTLNKTCDAGNCQGGFPLDCSNLTQGCNIGICDQATGMCTTMSVMNGQVCDDLNACTVGETCNNQVCSGGMMVSTCSQVPDGCCPGNCNAQNDFDCNCMPSTHVVDIPFSQTTGWGGGCCNEMNYKVGQGPGSILSATYQDPPALTGTVTSVTVQIGIRHACNQIPNAMEFKMNGATIGQWGQANGPHCNCGDPNIALGSFMAPPPSYVPNGSNTVSILHNAMGNCHEAVATHPSLPPGTAFRITINRTCP